MITIRQLLKAKNDPDTWSVSPNASVYDALQLMATKDVGAILIIENDRMIGIFTERDYARKIILNGKTSLTTPIKEIMSKELFLVSPEQTVDECLALMTKHHIRHLPVMSEDNLIGMVSMRDVVAAILEHKASTIDSMASYILGLETSQVWTG